MYTFAKVVNMWNNDINDAIVNRVDIQSKCGVCGYQNEFYLHSVFTWHGTVNVLHLAVYSF